MNYKQTRIIDEETFDFGLGAVPPKRHTNNRHVVGEEYSNNGEAFTYACNFRLFNAAGDSFYFQTILTLKDYDKLSANSYRETFIPACHRLSLVSFA